MAIRFIAVALVLGFCAHARAEKSGYERRDLACEGWADEAYVPRRSAARPEPLFIEGAVYIHYGARNAAVEADIRADALAKLRRRQSLVTTPTFTILSDRRFQYVADLSGQYYWGFTNYKVEVSF